MTYRELMRSLGVRGSVSVDDVWPVSCHDAWLACIFCAEVRRTQHEVEASVAVFDDAPLGRSAPMQVLCCIRAVQAAEGWIVTDGQCCGVDIRRGRDACEFFRLLVEGIESGQCFDHVRMFNAVFGADVLPAWGTANR